MSEINEWLSIARRQAALLEKIRIERASDRFFANTPKALTAEIQLQQIDERCREALNSFVSHMSRAYEASSLLEWYGNLSVVSQDLWLRGVLAENDKDCDRQRSLTLFLRPVKEWLAKNVEAAKETAWLVEALVGRLSAETDGNADVPIDELDLGSGTAERKLTSLYTQAPETRAWKSCKLAPLVGVTDRQIRNCNIYTDVQLRLQAEAEQSAFEC